MQLLYSVKQPKRIEQLPTPYELPFFKNSCFYHLFTGVFNVTLRDKLEHVCNEKNSGHYNKNQKWNAAFDVHYRSL